MATEFDHLRALAEAATPGPWEVPESIHGDPYINEVGKGLLSGGNIALANTRDDYGRSNAAYIAAANPAVMLALLDRLVAVEALCQRWEKQIGTGIPPSRQPATDLRAALRTPPGEET